MNTKRFLFLTLVVLIIVTTAGCSTAGARAGKSQTPPPLPVAKTLEDPLAQELNALVQQAAARREDVLAFLIYHVVIDRVEVSADGRLALVWFALADPDTLQIQPGEPGLVIAERSEGDAGWKLTFQADRDWVKALGRVPAEMLDDETRSHYMPAIQKAPKEPVVYTGYRLPWKGGQSKYLTGSIGHVYTYKSCPSDCLYAFDFADGTMFPVVAARRGKVKYAVWKYPNGNTTNPNYIVLEDTSTNPTTYQVYLHFAQDSIPPALRVRGAEVVQGQFLGYADDTGYSTGHHLHFHVHANPNAYWGTSVDITFDDVNINGGRPRTCYEAQHFPSLGKICLANNLFLSKNGDSQPPTGDITAPANNARITSPVITVEGWGKDDIAVEAMQVLIDYGAGWQPFGPLQSASPFSFAANLCEAGIPNGAFELSIQVMDKAGKYSENVQGLTHLTKDYTCPPPEPVCPPEPGQISLYTEPLYQGACQRLGVGDYASLAAFETLSGQPVQSIQLGAGTAAILYSQPNLSGSQETFLASDPNLADNSLAPAQIASAAVFASPSAPPVPVMHAPVNAAGQPATDADELTLTWEAPIDPTAEYGAELTGPQGLQRLLDWQKKKQWSVGMLPAGEYTWTLAARNPLGESHSTLQFAILPADPPPSTTLEALPEESLSSALRLKVVVLEGAADLAKVEIQARVGSGAWTPWKDVLPGDKEVWYFGLPGKTYAFRVRGTDAKGNVEEFPTQADAVTKIAAACEADAFDQPQGADDGFASAALLAPGVPGEHNFCPINDEDWMAFEVEEGSSYRLESSPLSPGAGAALQVFQADGMTLLAEAVPPDLTSSARVEWTAAESGRVYVRAVPADDRLAGTETRYGLRLEKTSQVQPGVLVCGSLLLPLLAGGGMAAKRMMKKRR